jgi:uncharacterized protein YggE
MSDDLNGDPVELSSRSPRVLGAKVLTALVVVALLVGGAALGLAISKGSGASQAAITCNSSTPKLTVQGTGQATRTPDVLIAVLAVNITAPTAQAALSQDNDKALAVVAALAGGGVARKDIQTTGLSLQPQYSYPKGVQTVTGYQVSNTVTATVNQSPAAGATIDAVVAAGGNAVTINSLSYSFRNPQVVEDIARASAVHQAVSHARAMALAAGRRLGPVCSLTDQTQSPPPYEFGSVALSGSAGQTTSGAAPVPLEAGSQSESDQVTMVYALGYAGG